MPGFYLLYIFFLLNLGQIKSHLFQRHKFSQRSLEKNLKPNVSASLLFKIKAPCFPHAYEIDGRCPGSLLPAQSLLTTAETPSLCEVPAHLLQRTHIPVQSLPTHCSSPQQSHCSGITGHILAKDSFTLFMFFLPFSLSHFHSLNLSKYPLVQSFLTFQVRPITPSLVLCWQSIYHSQL